MVYVSKKPLWVEHMPSLNRVNPEVFTSHTHLVFHQVKLSTTNVIFEIQEVNERICIGEVGVDLEPCAHAHGCDIYPIMKASCSNSYFLDIISFDIGEVILCNRGFDHMFFLDPISRAGLSTCLLWINTLVQLLL